jgi:hypothetical protein
LEVRSTLSHLWHAFADAFGAFLDEVAFRCSLAYNVILGRVPMESEKRYWNRSIETPVLVTVYDWTDRRRIFSILVWPCLDTEAEEALQEQALRVETVKQVIARGAKEMNWSMLIEADYGLQWDHRTRVWRASDGYAHDGELPRDLPRNLPRNTERSVCCPPVEARRKPTPGVASSPGVAIPSKPLGGGGG